MIYDFDKEVDRRGSDCEKHDGLMSRFGSEEVIALWVADTDFETPEFIMEAIRRRATHPVLGYTYRSESYLEAIKGWMERRYGWHVEPSALDFSPGVVCGVSQSINMLSEVGDSVVIMPPIYPPFARTIKSNSRDVVTCPLLLGDNGKYEIDFIKLDEVLSTSKLFILCNPHNPVGKAFTREELTKIGELCIKHEVKIISDDIHADIVYSGHCYTPIASLSKEIADITVTLIAPSKTFNTAGLSTSVIVITNPELMALYQSVADKIHATQGNIFGTEALKAAYSLGDEWLEQLLTYLEGNAKFVEDYIREHIPAIQCTLPEATFLMWLDCRALGLKPAELRSFMIEKAKLALNDGSDFGVEGDCFMRLNIGTTRAVLAKAMENLKIACNTLK